MDPSQKPTNKKSPKANAKIESPFNTKYTKAPMEMPMTCVVTVSQPLAFPSLAFSLFLSNLNQLH
jgi:hypothetical protein